MIETTNNRDHRNRMYVAVDGEYRAACLNRELCRTRTCRCESDRLSGSRVMQCRTCVPDTRNRHKSIHGRSNAVLCCCPEAMAATSARRVTHCGNCVEDKTDRYTRTHGRSNAVLCCCPEAMAATFYHDDRGANAVEEARR